MLFVASVNNRKIEAIKKSFLGKGINLKVQKNQIFGHMDNKWKVHHGDKKSKKTAFL